MDKHRNPDGTYNGVGVLSELTGMDRYDVMAAWEAVKANQAKLNTCPYHEFEPSVISATERNRKYRCKHCGGQVDATAFHWHEQGRRAWP